MSWVITHQDPSFPFQITSLEATRPHPSVFQINLTLANALDEAVCCPPFCIRQKRGNFTELLKNYAGGQILGTNEVCFIKFYGREPVGQISVMSQDHMIAMIERDAIKSFKNKLGSVFSRRPHP